MEKIQAVFGHPSWKKADHKSTSHLMDGNHEYRIGANSKVKINAANWKGLRYAFVIFLVSHFPLNMLAQKLLSQEPKSIVNTSVFAIGDKIADFYITSVGVEIPIRKNFAFESQFGKIFDGNFHLEHVLDNEYNYQEATNTSELSNDTFNFSINAGVKYYKKGVLAKSTFYSFLQMHYQSAEFKGDHGVTTTWVYNDAQDWLSQLFGIEPSWGIATTGRDTFQVTSQVLSSIINIGWRGIIAQRISFDIYSGLGFSINTAHFKNLDKGTPYPSYPGYDGQLVRYKPLEQSYSTTHGNLAGEFGVKLGFLIY